ncbi:MAG: MFS transporter [Clostridiales bacterium]|nr:MFS transporter [Clostridiales bacterium]
MKKNNTFIRNTINISLAFAWISVFTSVFDALIQIIATAPVADGGLGFYSTGKGVIMALDNILALFLLPLFGILSDRSRSRFGRRTPYILVFSIAAVVTWTLAGATLGLDSKWIFLILLGVTLSFNAMARPAALSLLPDVTPLSLRRKANAVTQIVSIIATVVGIGLCELKAVIGFQWIFMIDSAIMAVLIIIFAVTVRENKLVKEYNALPEVEKGADSETETFDFNVNRENLFRNKLLLLSAVFFFYVAFNGLVSSLSVYAEKVLVGLDKGGFTIPQLLCLVAACAAAVPVSKLSKKIKRRKLLITGLLIMLAAFVLAGLQRSLNAFMFISFLLAGGGYSVALVNLYPYVLELSDQNKIGFNTGLFNTVMTVAMVLTPIASGWLQDKLGYTVLFPYCIVALAISVLFLLFIKDAKTKAQPVGAQEAQTVDKPAIEISDDGDSGEYISSILK